MNELVNNLLTKFNVIPHQNPDKFLHEFAKDQLAIGNGRTIIVDGSEYLTRIYLRQGQPDFGMFLHYFHKGDQVRDLHSHPWEYAYSIVLTSGYDEERCEGPTGKIVHVSHKPGDVNVLTKDTYHRVDLLNGGAWTLFIRGPRIQGWGFLNRETREYTSMDADDSTND